MNCILAVLPAAGCVALLLQTSCGPCYAHDQTATDLQCFHQPNRCGPISLYVVCRIQGIETTIDELATLSGLNAKGTSMAGLVQAAEAKGLAAKAYQSNMRHLKSQTGPCVIDLPAGHFCVLYTWKGGQALIVDPPGPDRFLTADQVEHLWGKHVITFAPLHSKR